MSSISSENVFRNIFTGEYLSAPGPGLAVWDHAITFDSEVQYVWSRSKPPLVTKVVYISNRYFADAVLAFTAYYLSSINLVSVYVRASSFVVFMNYQLIMYHPVGVFFSQAYVLTICITLATTQTTVAWEILNQWEWRKTISRLLIVVSLVCIPTFVVTAVVGARITSNFLLSPTVRGSAGSLISRVGGFGLALAGSDLLIIFLAIFNTMARPQRKDHGLIFALHRDSAAMYTVRDLYITFSQTTTVAAGGVRHPHRGICDRNHFRCSNKLHSATVILLFIHPSGEPLSVPVLDSPAERTGSGSSGLYLLRMLSSRPYINMFEMGLGA
ncbi:hypothetical protein BD779DRAFT_1675234 [Infundibulicybe gibba]|nr:hypothetical protein BD779DRAFT_1675234 [Infundibulicybe gibba]